LITRTLAGVARAGTVLVFVIAVGGALITWALFEAVGRAPALEDEADA